MQSFTRDPPNDALSRCVGGMAGVPPKSAIHAYRPSRLANDLPQRSPVLKTNRTLRVSRQKHMQIRIAEK
jgi:hypothetical protein